MMDKMDEPFDKLGEAIQLASQADSDAVKEDDNLKTFERLSRQLEVQQRLILEAVVQKRKTNILQEIKHIDNSQELIEKFQQASVKCEENLQIHCICQRALEASQYSLVLQSEKSVDPAAEKIEDELVEASIEYLNLCLSNLSGLQQVESLQSELKEVQEKVQQAQLDNLKLRTDPRTNAGIKSEKIENLESKFDKYSGRYNFSRFLTQLLLMTSEEDLNDPKISQLFVKCGDSLE